MIGKLIKYDFRSCWKKFWSVWAAIIVISIINGFSLQYCERFNNYTFFVNTLPKLLLSGIAIAAIVIALLYIYNEFSHGLLGQQGYLMFTLPAKEEELIASKAIVALIMEAISMAVVIVCVVLIAFIATPEYIMNMLGDTFVGLTECDAPWLLILFGIECILFAVMSAVSFNFHIYTSVSIGHLFSKNKRVVGIIAFIAISIISIFIATRISPLLELVHSGICNYASDWRTHIVALMATIGIIILTEAIYSAIMFFAVRYILKNKLNLE